MRYLDKVTENPWIFYPVILALVAFGTCLVLGVGK